MPAAKPSPSKTGPPGASTAPGARSSPAASTGAKGKHAVSAGDSKGNVTKATGPTPARRALDGPELPEPSEAEVESEIQRLLTNQDDTEPPTELTLVRHGLWGRGSGKRVGRTGCATRAPWLSLSAPNAPGGSSGQQCSWVAASSLLTASFLLTTDRPEAGQRYCGALMAFHPRPHRSWCSVPTWGRTRPAAQGPPGRALQGRSWHHNLASLHTWHVPNVTAITHCPAPLHNASCSLHGYPAVQAAALSRPSMPHALPDSRTA